MDNRRSSYENVKRCLKSVFRGFAEIRKEMALRSKEDHNLLGDLITSTEIELDKKIKNILDLLPAPVEDEDPDTDVTKRKNPLVDATGKTSYEHVSDCLKIVEKEFYERIQSMRIRRKQEQESIGDMLQRLQSTITKSIKKILDECYVPPMIPLDIPATNTGVSTDLEALKTTTATNS